MALAEARCSRCVERHSVAFVGGQTGKIGGQDVAFQYGPELVESFLGSSILLPLRRGLEDNDGKEWRSADGEVRRPGKYSMKNRGKTGRQPTTIPLPISADLFGQSASTVLSLVDGSLYAHMLRMSTSN